MSRSAMRQVDVKNQPQDFDTKLDSAILRLKSREPEAFEMICFYIRSLAMPLEYNAELSETVKAAQHKNALAAKIARRLHSLDELN